MATTTKQPGSTKPRDTRPFWRRHFLKLTVTPIGIAIAIWFLVIQPRTTKTVDEAFPTAAPARTAITAAQPVATTAPAQIVPATSPAQPVATSAPTVQAAATVQPTAQQAPVVAPQPTTAATVAAPVPATVAPPATTAPIASGPVAVKSGDFVAAEHSGSGKATIFKQADGTYILRFENLDVTNGPDLRVRLLGAGGTSIDLGGLKGNKGNQNYALPADFDPAKYDTADIWCRAFKSQFNMAALT